MENQDFWPKSLPKSCVRCKTEVKRTSDNICSKCRGKLTVHPYCIGCGELWPKDQKMCGYCSCTASSTPEEDLVAEGPDFARCLECVKVQSAYIKGKIRSNCENCQASVEFFQRPRCISCKAKLGPQYGKEHRCGSHTTLTNPLRIAAPKE